MTRQNRSPAIDAANKMFKQPQEDKVTDHAKAEQAFGANRERLKAERLAREAEQRAQAAKAR